MKREKHNGRKTRLYVTWYNMRNRCNNIKNKEYFNYGGRGIKVCKEWYSFTAFRDWAIKNGYKDTLTIDRIDNNGDYCPENCRFITLKMQANNRTDNHYITYKGKTQTLKQWAEELNIPYYRLRSRFNNCKYDIQKAFSKETYEQKALYSYKGETKRLCEWCRELGINYQTTKRRLALGWSVERAFEE